MNKKKKIIIWSVLGAMVVGLVAVKIATDRGSEIDIEFKNTIKEPLLEGKYSTFLHENANVNKNISFTKDYLPSVFDSNKAPSSVPNYETPTLTFA